MVGKFSWIQYYGMRALGILILSRIEPGLGPYIKVKKWITQSKKIKK